MTLTHPAPRDGLASRLGRKSIVAAAIVASVVIASVAQGQVADDPTVIETPVEEVVAVDDADIALAPVAREDAANPTSEHVRLMQELTAARLHEATDRANRLESARRTAPVDLLWGIR